MCEGGGLFLHAPGMVVGEGAMKGLAGSEARPGFHSRLSPFVKWTWTALLDTGWQDDTCAAQFRTEIDLLSFRDHLRHRKEE